MENILSYVQIRGSSECCFRFGTGVADVCAAGGCSSAVLDAVGLRSAAAATALPRANSHAEPGYAPAALPAHGPTVRPPRASFRPLSDVFGRSRVALQSIVNLAEQHGKEGAITEGYREYVRALGWKDAQ